MELLLLDVYNRMNYKIQKDNIWSKKANHVDLVGILLTDDMNLNWSYVNVDYNNISLADDDIHPYIDVVLDDDASQVYDNIDLVDDDIHH